MVLNVPADLCSRGAVPDRRGIVPGSPEVCSPEGLVELGELLAESLRRDALQDVDRFGDRDVWRKREKAVDVVLLHGVRVEVRAVPLADPREEFPEPRLACLREDAATVLRDPHEVVLRAVRRVGALLEPFVGRGLPHLSECIREAGRPP